MLLCKQRGACGAKRFRAHDVLYGNLITTSDDGLITMADSALASVSEVLSINIWNVGNVTRTVMAYELAVPSSAGRYYELADEDSQ